MGPQVTAITHCELVEFSRSALHEVSKDRGLQWKQGVWSGQKTEVCAAGNGREATK